MAQQDTGLGWSAKEEWLLSAAPAALASIVDISSSALAQVPTGTTIADIRATDFWYSDYQGFHSCFVVEPGTTAYFFYAGNSAVYCSSNQVPRGFNGMYEGTWRSDYSGPVNEVENFTQDPDTGLYYGYAAVPSSGHNPNLPTFNSISEGLSTISIYLQTYNKLAPGYAVACVARWITPEGNSFVSPVIISTVPEAVVITTDGTTPATGFTSFDFLRDGLHFYMGIVSGLSPSADISTVLQEPNLSQFGAAAPSKVFSLLASPSFSNILTSESPDPYQEEAGESGEEGGDGEDQEDDPVEEETLPVPSVAGHGFCTIYVPSSQELGQMAAYLWSGAFDVDQVIKLFSNPMDSILGLSAVPVDLVGTSEQIYLGGVPLTNITMPKYTGRTSVKVDFGTATIDKRWGSYLDYDPYTEFSIYLPFIGIKPLKADDIMEKTISLTYAIDILSGGCVAYIRPAGGSVLYEWSGQCALQIPVTARNYDNVFQTAMSVVGAVGAAVVAPASAPVLSGAVASAAVQAAATKPRIERSGTVNGITGFLGQLRPYILRTIPEAYIPADQNKFIGYPAYINVDLASVRGYNEVDSIHLENVTATGAELEEIESILKGGVIF